MRKPVDTKSLYSVPNYLALYLDMTIICRSYSNCSLFKINCFDPT
jgi:hypothetical protein